MVNGGSGLGVEGSGSKRKRRRALLEHRVSEGDWASDEGLDGEFGCRKLGGLEREGVRCFLARR